MNMQKTSILINIKSVKNVLQDLTNEEAGIIFKALVAYADNGEEFKSEDRLLKLCFRTIKDEVVRNNERYEDTCEKRRQAINKRWEAKKPKLKSTESHTFEDASPTQNTNTYKCIQSDTKPYKVIQGDTNDSDNDYHEPNGSDSLREANASLSKQSLDAAMAATEAHTREGEEPCRMEKSDENAYVEQDTTASREKPPRIDFDKVRLQWNRAMDETGAKLPRLKAKITGRRKDFFAARARENGIVACYRVIIKASRSDFLNGGGSRGAVFDFEWVFRPNNFPKVLEGNYDNNHETLKQAATNPTNGENKYGKKATRTSAGSSRATGLGSNIGRLDAERCERLQGYASVAEKWRRTAEQDTTAMANQRNVDVDILRGQAV